MTTSNKRMLMWAYYVNHMGCCVEFDTRHLDGIRKVEYKKRLIRHEELGNEDIVESLYYKGYEWKHENEYRRVYYRPSANDNTWKRVGDDVFLRAPVKSITFGYASESDIKYQEILEYLLEYNNSHERTIDVRKCKLNQTKYQLDFEKQFDIELELERIKQKVEREYSWKENI